jgi:hypothetical protein
VSRRALLGLAVAALVLAGVLFTALRPQAPPPTPRLKQSAYIPPASLAKVASAVRFTDVTATSGIDFVHDGGAFLRADGSESRYMPETMGPGVVLFDYDGDGDLDVFVPSAADSAGMGRARAAGSRLYRNDGALHFADVTDAAALARATGMGGAAADYDGDGDVDLFVTGWGGSKLLRNDGHGRFEDVTAQMGLAARHASPQGPPSWSTGTAFLDVDGDRKLDLFIANYVQWSPQTDIFSTIDGTRKSYSKPDLYPGSSCQLFVQRAGRFAEVTRESGVYKASAKGLGVALWDTNGDGKLDIVVANDTQPNFLFEAVGDGRFVERGLEAGIAYDENGATRAGMGVDVADIENAGSAAIAIGNFSREPVSLFKRSGASFFREASQQAGVAGPTLLSLTFGLSFADLDFDGWQDLVVVNGHIEPRIQEVEGEIPYREPMQVLGNTRDGRFTDWSASAGDVQQPMVGRGVAYADLDGDGDLDLVVAENNAPLHVLRNDRNPRATEYLRVELRGRAPNTAALGAILELRHGAQTQRRVVRTGSSYLSQSEMTQSFGLTALAPPTELIVTWPDGTVQRLAAHTTKLSGVLIVSEGAGTAQVRQDPG